jgi:hypothetical protein
MARWNSANVLQTMPGGRRLWRYSAKGDHFHFDQEITLTLSEMAPAAYVGKDWQSLVWPRLNMAWLPLDKVFIRAVQLPVAEISETAAMLELQLEKISPLPVTHIVWSFYLMPRPATAKPDALQNVIVVIALRSYVEEYLGELQLQGFQPDRIESPGLDQLLAAKMNGEGVWIFPGGPEDPVLMVWQYGGAIQNVTVLPLPAGPERGAQLKAHLEQIAWAGELEGWLTKPPRIHLVAGPAEAGVWEPLFRPWADPAVEIVPPASPADLAALSAERAGRDGTSTNLLPAEFSARYHQQLVDRLWMRGVLSVVAVYLFGVLVYFGILSGLKHQYNLTCDKLASISAAYTNAMEDQEQIQILQERQNLKYAALDCWRAVAENLPETVTLEDMYFARDKFDLHGSSTSDETTDIASFNDALRHAQDASHSGPLFSEVGVPRTSSHGNKTDWTFSCAIVNKEAP